MVNGVTIPKGAVVTIPIGLLHYSPLYWIHPEKFDPERLAKLLCSGKLWQGFKFGDLANFWRLPNLNTCTYDAKHSDHQNLNTANTKWELFRQINARQSYPLYGSSGRRGTIPACRTVARLIERGVHVKNMRASGHTTYNIQPNRFKLSTNTCIILG